METGRPGAQRRIRAGTLEVAYEEHGDPAAPATILLHGFPDDVRSWDGVAAPLAARGRRVIVPWLRGYGATRFLDPATPRSGEQAALGEDLRQLMDALELRDAALAGYDWGGRAACVVSALWPERVRALVTVGGYNLQTIAKAGLPASPDQEHRLWYQWYFQTERGRAGLEQDRDALCRLLWRLWSPNCHLGDAEFARTAASWDTPDFVAVVIHSYRHRHQAAPGDPALAGIEAALARTPPIRVPTIALDGESDGVHPLPDGDPDAAHFTGRYRRERVPVAGHFLPREAPGAVLAALAELDL